jgi:hypothetical protein
VRGVDRAGRQASGPQIKTDLGEVEED